MTLRTSALVAGVLGVILLVVGLYADSQRADTTVVANATVDTPVVVLEPAMVALEGATRLAFNGEGTIEVHTARPVDADAWLSSRSVTFITGIPEWEVLSTRVAERIVAPSPEPSPDPSASAGVTPTPSPSPAASPSPSPSASPGPEQDEPVADLTSGDHWRSTWRGTDRVSVAVSAIPAGETLVVTSLDGSPLTRVELTVERTTNEGWITPLILWGAFLTLLGLVALVLAIIDIRPWQRKGEEWLQRRTKAEAGIAAPTEGSRRARRAAGTQIPAVSLEEPEATSLEKPEVTTKEDES